MSDKDIENEIIAKGKTAPRVTPQHIENVIVEEHYFTTGDAVNFGSSNIGPDDSAHPNLDLLTNCVLVLKNGFTVTGDSACASPENFDAEIGRKTARNKAVSKIWELEGYLLKQRLYEASCGGAPAPLHTSTPPHQVRAMEELLELNQRLDKLTSFIEGKGVVYLTLDKEEQERLRKQAEAMAAYQKILADRIAHF